MLFTWFLYSFFAPSLTVAKYDYHWPNIILLELGIEFESILNMLSSSSSFSDNKQKIIFLRNLILIYLSRNIKLGKCFFMRNTF